MFNINKKKKYSSSNTTEFNFFYTNISVQVFLGLGSHFGPINFKDWSIESSFYIHSKLNDRVFLDISVTSFMFSRALCFIKFCASRNLRPFFFLKQSFINYMNSSKLIPDFLNRVSYLVHRWVPGFLTNYANVKNLLKRRYYFYTNLYKFFPNFCIYLGGNSGYSEISNEFRKIKIPSVGLVDADMGYAPFSYSIPSNNKSFPLLFFYYRIFSFSIIQGWKHFIFFTSKKYMSKIKDFIFKVYKYVFDKGFFIDYTTNDFYKIFSKEDYYTNFNYKDYFYRYVSAQANYFNKNNFFIYYHYYSYLTFDNYFDTIIDYYKNEYITNKFRNIVKFMFIPSNNDFKREESFSSNFSYNYNESFISKIGFFGIYSFNIYRFNNFINSHKKDIKNLKNYNTSRALRSFVIRDFKVGKNVLFNSKKYFLDYNSLYPYDSVTFGFNYIYMIRYLFNIIFHSYSSTSYGSLYFTYRFGGEQVYNYKWYKYIYNKNFAKSYGQKKWNKKKNYNKSRRYFSSILGKGTIDDNYYIDKDKRKSYFKKGYNKRYKRKEYDKRKKKDYQKNKIYLEFIIKLYIIL